MDELDDHELLARYAEGQSEASFGALVDRHVNLVYSTALRFTGNAHHAEEVTQVVFVILARKSNSLGRKVILSGWLYQTARLSAANFVKSEIRRHRREQEIYMQSSSNESHAAAWEQIAPFLDEAMGRLGEADRDAVVLRFFENKTAREVAAKLKMSEAAAHKRMQRALAKLRGFFLKRGVILPVAVIGGAMAANSTHAAPAMMAKAATAVALAKGVASGGSTLTLVETTLKIMAFKKSAVITAGIVVALLLGVTISVPQFRNAVKSVPKKLAGALPGMDKKQTVMKQMGALKSSVWPGLMKYSREHGGQFPKTMDELRPYLPKELASMDDNHWRITAGDAGTKPPTPGRLTFCEEINQPKGEPRMILYADGHVEYRR